LFAKLLVKNKLNLPISYTLGLHNKFYIKPYKLFPYSIQYSVNPLIDFDIPFFLVVISLNSVGLIFNFAVSK